MGELGRCWFESTNFHLEDESVGGSTHSVVIIDNNTVLYTGKLLRVDLKCSHHKKEMVLM